MNQGVEKIFDIKDIFKLTNETGAKCIFIAAGSGAFGPTKPPIKDIENYEKKSVFYNIKDKSLFKDKLIAIAGGGDSAVD